MIAIHEKSGSFAPGWVEFCRTNNIPFRIVDCFSSDIMKQLEGCRILMWHWEHHDFAAKLFARQLILSAEERGLVVFPSSSTCWHYDDKIGQKYLLESINAPLVPTHIFYEKEEALRWIDRADFPKVWKLRAGAGSRDVRLVQSRAEARRIVARAFGKGWSISRFHVLRERLWHLRRDRNARAVLKVLRSFWWSVFPDEKTRNRPIEKDYVYFQDFVPQADHDTRVVVIGDRCYGFRRFVRSGDFRASGSGMIDADPDKISLDAVRHAFAVSQRLRMQSAAFDFIVSNDESLIIEISYAFSLYGYKFCSGYWNRELDWIPDPIYPERFMVEDALAIAKGRA